MSYEKENTWNTSPLNCIDITAWEQFHSNISNLLDISIAVYDAKGFEVYPSNREDSLYAALKENAKYRELYQKAYVKVITRALERGETYIYRCFTNQYIFAVPVTLDNNISLAIVGGHAYLDKSDYRKFLDENEEVGLGIPRLHDIEADLKILPSRAFFAKPNTIRNIAVPFLRNLYQKGYYEREYFQLKTLLQATTPLDTKKDKREIYKNLFNTLAVLFDIDSVAIMEKDEQGIYRPYVAFGRKSDTISKWTLPESAEIVKMIKEIRKPARYDGSFDLKKIGLGNEITSLHILPMSICDDVSGLLCIFNTDVSKKNINLISLLANQLSMVIEGIRREEIIKKRVSGLDTLGEIYRDIAPVLNQEELYDTILERSIELVGAEKGSLMTFNEKSDTLSVKAARGINKSILEGLKIRVGEGISGMVVEKGNPVIVKDIESEPFGRKNRSRYKTGSFVSIPLKVDSRMIGVINISDKIGGEVFSEEDMHLLFSFSYYASVVLERGTYYRMTKELKTIAVTDSLTGVVNRRYFQERLLEEVERSRRYNEPFTLFMIDIDDFKVLNDRYGHLAGDEVLRKVAHVIRDVVRSIDVVARFGGEEFTVILPNTRKKASIVTAERIRTGVELARFMNGRIPPEESLTVSIGIAEFPTDASVIEDIIDKADKALYMAKAKGKNRIREYSVNAYY